jgi:hypothetical protein
MTMSQVRTIEATSEETVAAEVAWSAWERLCCAMTVAVLWLLVVGGFDLRSAAAHDRPSRIALHEVELQNVSLRYGLEMWHVRGNVVNHAPIDLQAFTLMVRIRDCADRYRCIVVGEQFVTVSGLKLPPQQKRHFHKVITFPNLAKAKKPKHEFVVIRTFEDYSEEEYYTRKRYRPFDLSEW